MSEDSDYTSDINYPLQHHHNSSAHQFRNNEHAYFARPYDTINSQDYTQGGDSYGQETYNHTESFDRGYGHQEAPQRYDYYNYRRDSPYQQGRSDSESDPMSYNSRPRSYMTERLVSSRSLW